MQPTFLTKARRLTELVMSFYGIYFGTLVVLLLDTGLGDPLYWVWPDQAEQKLVGLAFLTAGIIHAIGVNLNGSWRWSPALRVVGLALHTGLMARIFWAGAWQEPYGVTSGGITYLPFVLVFGFFAFAAFRDLIQSLRLWSAIDGLS